jgi:superfamily II RNA helicase
MNDTEFDLFKTFKRDNKRQGDHQDRNKQPKRIKLDEIPEILDDQAMFTIKETKIKNGVYEYVAPKDWHRPEYIKSDKPAKEYPFVLDPFQTTAIECVERKESVLVLAKQ